jgi:hypothetical protein
MQPAHNLAQISPLLELLEAAVLSASFDNSIGGCLVDRCACDSQSGASAAKLVACGTVPTIVPETRQNSVSTANTSQLARSAKWKRVKDLREKTTMSERRISV